MSSSPAPGPQPQNCCPEPQWSAPRGYPREQPRGSWPTSCSVSTRRRKRSNRRGKEEEIRQEREKKSELPIGPLLHGGLLFAVLGSRAPLPQTGEPGTCSLPITAVPCSNVRGPRKQKSKLWCLRHEFAPWAQCPRMWGPPGILHSTPARRPAGSPLPSPTLRAHGWPREEVRGPEGNTGCLWKWTGCGAALRLPGQGLCPESSWAEKPLKAKRRASQRHPPEAAESCTVLIRAPGSPGLPRTHSGCSDCLGEARKPA